ncbi:UDP-N-acetylmuramate dehydrogenase [Thiocapsa marina]|uniref:UDP-N-acetylenolpyruvoylglucosamine reductase n=1 Tax=Thiocapsa marina 5811 TaxID=768671 RepID=F9U8G6_9GAMM|nr:UDP-N-acetylmuramate dehydrogenase [Thiocapsa marina]EGV19578.1 UDP-N-acetylenolpyruvoylglucosamine reductase [Thiocapsa marina 5811]
MMGELREREPLSRHTSWRVGGPARRFYRPTDAEDLAAFLERLDPGEPLLWLGLGSNLLVDDAGFPGTVIQTQACLTRLERRGATGIYAESGVSCAKVARFASRHDLVGCEFLAGIPGTMGGALAMNAGAWGGETWAHVVSVRTIDRVGRIRERVPGDFSIGYREVLGPPGEWFLDVALELAPGDGKAGMARIRELLDRRAQTQPVGLPSCGSVFRNPPGDHAARLIESEGLKGYRIGGAQVSEKHANFIINTGDASAADIRELIDLVQRRVEDATGVRLVPEVKHIAGEQP